MTHTLIEDISSLMLDEVRRRFPTDPAGQKAIDRKYHRRRGPIWEPIPLEVLSASVDKLLRSKLDHDFEIHDPRWLTGGASKIQMFFELVVDGREPQRLLLRMDPPESLNATNKSSEFGILRRLAGSVAAPEALWVDEEAEHLPEPGLVCSFVHGVTKPTTASTGQVTGLGTNFGPELRPLLGEQLVRNLATLHTIDTSDWISDELPGAAIGSTDLAQWRLNFERQLWSLDRLDSSPIMELAAHWLARNLPTLDRLSVVHGDYRSGNFLFDEETAQITAWLDWESGHLGDRHMDLAYCSQDLFGHYDEAGSTFLVSGLVPREEFFDRYEQASGLSVDPDRLRWYSILCGFSATVKTLATSMRIAQLGRSHQDVLLARLEGTVPILLGQLGRQLEKVI
ncbi:phosphotransferase family protein [Rhodococcoides kyotonense]|uniref:Predicted kinase, aminoglycoside phosphotransferase (APT) family n=1 Tax=Rhodococcoides kyotonense TaxID=398843 RepID=A0A239K3S7_9NOCA|nr:phosphotransferase family protein [Rhodococcus kyotonensis]SNT12319.1 Predicted kinase, aminoglycoside phosphotransferase (APT) family [Rhodococcus kyotonensis]